MSGAQYIECNVNGDFTLDDQWGLNNYISMSASNANYGSVESHPFCIYNTGSKDFFINEIEAIENIEVLAFEDALENNNKDMTSIDAKNSALNDA